MPFIPLDKKAAFWQDMVVTINKMANNGVYLLDGANPNCWEYNETTHRPQLVAADKLTRSRRRVEQEGFFYVKGLGDKDPRKWNNRHEASTTALILLLIHETNCLGRYRTDHA
jgi:hypothetical protein